MMRFLLALGVVAALALPDAAQAGIGKGDRAIELVNAKDARGRKVKLRSYRGKWVVITFGASWCKPCKEELPAWEKLAKAYRAAGKPVTFIAVNIDEDGAAGRAFVAKAKLAAMLAAYDPSRASADAYDPPTMPTTYVIDPNGLVRVRHEGYRKGDDGKLRSALDGLIK
jgi:thiol-disulfide isomerase/thioredoxin